MNFAFALLLALSSNVDNFAVATAYGVKKLRIDLMTNIFIAFVSALGTFLSISVGKEIGGYLSPALANGLGSFTLIGIGTWGVWETWKREKVRAKRHTWIRQEMGVLASVGSSQMLSKSVHTETHPEFSQEFLKEFSYENFLENPEQVDEDQSGYIDVRESIALAFGLSLNNIGAGLGAGISAVSAGLTTGLVFGLSILAMIIGYRFGNRSTTRMSGFLAGTLSGGMLILIGVFEYFVFP
jgi:putative Mn2+ efflux pump MntP